MRRALRRPGASRRFHAAVKRLGWRASWLAGEHKRLTGFVSTPTTLSFYTDSWEVAEAGQVAAHIPLERRLQYAKIYAQVRSLRTVSDQARQDWRSLQDFEEAPALDAHDLMRLKGLVNFLGFYERNLATTNLESFRKKAEELGVVAEKQGPDTGVIKDSHDALCTPVFAR